MLYKNISEEHRVWPRLHAPDGTTLELEPGEEVHLNLPDEYEDPHLEGVGESPEDEACGGMFEDPGSEKDDELDEGQGEFAVGGVVDGPPVQLGDGGHETLVLKNPSPSEGDTDGDDHDDDNEESHV